MAGSRKKIRKNLMHTADSSDKKRADNLLLFLIALVIVFSVFVFIYSSYNIDNINKNLPSYPSSYKPFISSGNSTSVSMQLPAVDDKGKGVTIEFIPGLVPKDIDAGRDYIIGVNMINSFRDGVNVKYNVYDDFGEFSQSGNLLLEPSLSEEGFRKGEIIFKGNRFSNKPFGENVNPNEPLDTFFTAEVLYNRRGVYGVSMCVGEFCSRCGAKAG